MSWALIFRSATDCLCSIAMQTQQSVVSKPTATLYAYPSHRLVPPAGIDRKSWDLSSYHPTVYPGSHLLGNGDLQGYCLRSITMTVRGSGEDAQTGHPTRPQASRNRRRALRGTLRISMSREQSWGSVSASDQRWYFAMRYLSVLRVILRSRLASEMLPPVRCSASCNSFFSIS
jgi:hypothetical protein